MNRFARRFIAAITLACLAGPASAESPPDKSRPKCGAVIDGKLKPCESKYARYESAATFECPDGSDQSGNFECYECPKGYGRSFAAATSERACVIGDPSVKHEFMAATLVGPLCPEDSFYDPIRGGECWSCPKDYKRSAASVASKIACVRGIGGRLEWSPATVVKVAACESGSFLDVRNHGECWSCPSETIRTVYPVNGDKACARLGGRNYAPATKVGSRVCAGPESFWSGAGVNEEDLAEMRKRATEANNSDELQRLKGLKTAKAGTCWSCPSGYARSMAGIKTADACTPTQMQWETAPYKEPGLFNLAGADAVLLDVIRRNPKLAQDALDKAAAAMAANGKIAKDQALKQQKALLASNPEKSPAASALLLVRVLGAVAEPAKASPSETRLVESFRAYVSARRQYFAQDAIDAYDTWKATDDYMRSRVKGSLASLFDYGTVPPDFGALAVLGAVSGFARDTAIGVALDSVPVLGDVLALAFSAAGNGFADFSSIDKAIRFGARTAAETAVGAVAEGLIERLGKAAAEKALRAVMTRIAVKAGASWALEATEGAILAASSCGPQIIIGMATVIANMAIDQITEIKNARPKLVTALAGAKQLPDLQRMTRTSDGMMEIISLWAAAASGASTPGPAYLKDLAGATATLTP